MALHGIDLVFSFTGQEYIWRETYRELGLNDSQIQSGFNGPAFLAWSRGQGGHQNGGVFKDGVFDYSLSDEFLTGQWTLQKKIVSRQTALGIGSVLPAFMGNVPGPLKLLFPHANISGNGSPGSVWLDALDPLFATIGKSFLGKAIRDFGKTGYYEADGFFGTKAAPWMDNEHGHDSVTDTSPNEGSTLPSTHCSPAFSSRRGGMTSATECVFGAEHKMTYIPGEATDAGKIYKTLDEAKTACQKDTFCGGALSRSCNAKNTACTAFQTRSGMSPCPNAGVPCAGEHPKIVPEPVEKGAQNSYPITNTHACGHHAQGTHNPDNGWSGRAHAAAVYATMRGLDENATWVFQGWPWMRAFLGTHTTGWPDAAGRDYMRNFTAAVPAGKLLILDMRTECESLASRTESLYGTPFIWEVMDDFGGTNGMFGDVGLVRDQIAAASADLSGANLTTLGGWYH
jgi:hypothetical protein